MNKKEIKSEIRELKWRALPIADRLMYSKAICKEKKINLTEQLNIQKFNVGYTRNLFLFCMMLALVGPFVDSINWQLQALFISATFVAFVTKREMKRRLQSLKEAMLLAEKLKT